MLRVAALAPGLHLGGSYTLGVLFVGAVLFVGIGALSHQHDHPYSASVFYLLLGAVASLGGTGWLTEWVLTDVLYAVGMAVLIGVAAGWLIASAVTRLRARELLVPDLNGFFAPATALVVYGVAEALGTYGFLAVFAA